jgi:hypothetical protein
MMSVKDNVYIVKSGADGLVKIGSYPSNHTYEYAFGRIECESGREITLSFISPETERAVNIISAFHSKFDECNTYGNWFNIDFDDAVEVLQEFFPKMSAAGVKAPMIQDKYSLPITDDGISLLISDDGFVGVSGGRKLETPEDIDLVVSEVRRKLTFGYEHKDEFKGGDA